MVRLLGLGIARHAAAQWNQPASLRHQGRAARSARRISSARTIPTLAPVCFAVAARGLRSRRAAAPGRPARPWPCPAPLERPRAAPGWPAVLRSVWPTARPCFPMTSASPSTAPLRARQGKSSPSNAAAVEALGDPVVRSRLSDLGWEIFPRERQTPEALGAMVKADAEKWLPLIKGFGIKPASPNGP